MTDKDKQPRSAEPASPNGASDEGAAFGKTFLTAAGKVAAEELPLSTPGLFYAAIPDDVKKLLVVGGIGAAMTATGIAPSLSQAEQTPEGREKSPGQRATRPETGTARPSGGSEHNGGRTSAGKGAKQTAAGEVGGNDERTPVPPVGNNKIADESWKELEDFMTTPVGKASVVSGLIVSKFAPSIAAAGRALQGLKPTDVPRSIPGESGEKREPEKSPPRAKTEGSKTEGAATPPRDGGNRVGGVALSAAAQFAATMPKDTGDRPIEPPPSSPSPANAPKPPADPNRSRN